MYVNRELIKNTLSKYLSKREVNSRVVDIVRYVTEYDDIYNILLREHELRSSKIEYIEGVKSFDIITGDSHTLDDLCVDTVDIEREINKLRHTYWGKIIRIDDFVNVLADNTSKRLECVFNEYTTKDINTININVMIEYMYDNIGDLIEDSVIEVIESLIPDINVNNVDNLVKVSKLKYKVVIPLFSSFSESDFSDKYESINPRVRVFIDNIFKVFSLIDNRVETKLMYNESKDVFENSILRFKMFKNGNIHISFRDNKLLDMIILVAEGYYKRSLKEGVDIDGVVNENDGVDIFDKYGVIMV